MGGMPMHGEAMSMWTRMPGQTWPGFAGSFLWMWMTMMVPMMIPPFAVIMWRRRAAFGEGTMMGIGVGYFGVWCAIGLMVLPAVGVASPILSGQPSLAGAATPAIAVILLVWRMVQRTRWTRGRAGNEIVSSGARATWRRGVDLGIHCAQDCAPLMSTALVLGGMDARVMAAVTVATTLQRLLRPAPTRSSAAYLA